MHLILQHIEEIKKLCIKYRVSELYVFGSILTNKFNSDSDIDFIVSLDTLDPIEYAENYFSLKFSLEQLFNRKIDLLESKSLRNKSFKALINQDKKLVYAGQSQGVA